MCRYGRDLKGLNGLELRSPTFLVGSGPAKTRSGHRADLAGPACHGVLTAPSVRRTLALALPKDTPALRARALSAQTAHLHLQRTAGAVQVGAGPGRCARPPHLHTCASR